MPATSPSPTLSPAASPVMSGGRGFRGYRANGMIGNPDPLGQSLSSAFLALPDGAQEALTDAATFGDALTGAATRLLGTTAVASPVVKNRWTANRAEEAFYQVGFLDDRTVDPATGSTTSRVSGTRFGAMIVAAFEDDAWQPTTDERLLLTSRLSRRRDRGRQALVARRTRMVAERLLDVCCFAHTLEQALADPDLHDHDAMRGFIGPDSRVHLHALPAAPVAIAVWWQARINEGHSPESARILLNLLLPASAHRRITYRSDDQTPIYE